MLMSCRKMQKIALR